MLSIITAFIKQTNHINNNATNLNRLRFSFSLNEIVKHLKIAVKFSTTTKHKKSLSLNTNKYV